MLIRFTTSTSMVAAAVAALFLAGCGGGSDNSGGAGTESGGLSTKTNGTGAAGTNAANATGSTETTGTAGAADAGAAAPATAPASSHGAITEAGISTELFEKILSTQTAYVQVGPRAYPISRGYAASQLVTPDDTLDRPLDLNKWMDTPEQPDMLSYQQPVDGKFIVHSWGADRSGKNADGEIISAAVNFGYVFHKEADSPDKRLTLKTDAEIKNGYSRDPNTGAETYRETDTLKADAEKVIPRDGVVNFNEPVQKWTRSTGTPYHGGQLQLVVQRGSSPDEVMFCLWIASRSKNPTLSDPRGPQRVKSDVQRTVCSLWQVPANWTAKQSLTYNGIFVNEDLDVEGSYNEANTRYWKTKPASAATQDAAAAGQVGNGTAANTATDGAAAVNAGAAAATTGDATQNTAAQTANAAQADATSQAAAEAAAARDEKERAELLAILGITEGARISPSLRSQVRRLEDEQKRRAKRIQSDTLLRSMTEIQTVLRDVLTLQLNSGSALMNEHARDALAEFAARTSAAQTLEHVQALEVVLGRLRTNANARLLIEGFMGRFVL